MDVRDGVRYCLYDTSKCSAKFKSKRNWNLIRHLCEQHGVQNMRNLLDVNKSNSLQHFGQKTHDPIYTFSGEMTLTQFERHLLSIILDTSFCFLDNVGLKALFPNFGKTTFAINRKTAPKLIEKYFEIEKNILSSIIKDKFVCLKIDGGTKRDRHFLGVNMTVIVKNVLKNYDLGVIEIHESSNARNIMNLLLMHLNTYDIKKTQIFSVTTDNARNYLNVADELSNVIYNELDDELQNFHDYLENNNNFNDYGINEIRDDLSKIEKIKCATHTIQLVVNDVFKLHLEKIQVLAEYAIYLRKPCIKNILEGLKIKKPRMLVKTRWNYTFYIIEDILNFEKYNKVENTELFEYCSKFEQEIDWNFAREYVEVFKHIEILTVKTQQKHLIYTDFVIYACETYKQILEVS